MLVLLPNAPLFTIIDVNDAYLAATILNRDDPLGQALFDAFPDNPNDPSASGVANLRASLNRSLASGARQIPVRFTSILAQLSLLNARRVSALSQPAWNAHQA